MNKLLQSVNRRTSLSMAAVLISGSYFASRLLGLLRDRLLASHFGISPVTDAYTAAFRIPDLLFTLMVSGAFAVAFIPVFTEHWVKQERDEAWELSSSLLNLLMIGTLVLGVLAFIFADPLTSLIAPGFDPYRHQLTVELTRIMMVTPFLFAVSSVLGSIQQAFGRFLFFAMASVFYNLGIIAGIIFLSPKHSIYGVAYGVVIGAVLQGLVQLLGLAGLGYRYRLKMNLRMGSVRRVIKLMIPRSLDQGIDQINYTVQTVIGSRLAEGSLTAYYYANNLRNVPLVIFGSAIATAAFPGLATKAAEGNSDGLVEDLVFNTRLILFLVIPSATIAVLMRGYIVRLLFGFGNPTTASLLGWFAISIIFQSLFFLICRVYYALQDTKTPLYVSLVAVTSNIFLSYSLSAQYGVAGLAMSQSLVAASESIILWVLLRGKLPSLGLRSIASGVWRMLLSNAIMASAVYIMVAAILPLYSSDRGILVVGPKFALILVVGGLSYLIPCYAMRLREAKVFVNKLKSQALRPIL